MTKVNLYGEEADRLAKKFGLVMDGEKATFETNIKIKYRSIEGHSKVELEINV